jgi:hypothetical protein
MWYICHRQRNYTFLYFVRATNTYTSGRVIPKLGETKWRYQEEIYTDLYIKNKYIYIRIYT